MRLLSLLLLSFSLLYVFPEAAFSAHAKRVQKLKASFNAGPKPHKKSRFFGNEDLPPYNPEATFRDPTAEGEALLGRANKQLLDGEVDLAEANFKTLERKYYGFLNAPQKASIEFNLGNILWHQGRHEEAFSTYSSLFAKQRRLRRHLSPEQEFTGNWHQAELFMGKRKFKEAHELYEQVIKNRVYYSRLNQADQTRIKAGRASALFRVGKLAEDEDLARRALIEAFPTGGFTIRQPALAAEYYLARAQTEHRIRGFAAAKPYYAVLSEPEYYKHIAFNERMSILSGYGDLLKNEKSYADAARIAGLLLDDPEFVKRTRRNNVSLFRMEMLLESQQYDEAEAVIDKLRTHKTYRSLSPSQRAHTDLRYAHMQTKKNNKARAFSVLDSIWKRKDFETLKNPLKSVYLGTYLLTINSTGKGKEVLPELTDLMLRTNAFGDYHPTKQLEVMNIMVDSLKARGRHSETTELYKQIEEIQGRLGIVPE